MIEINNLEDLLNITSDNEYVLNTDIEIPTGVCPAIEVENIILDGQDHYISGLSSYLFYWLKNSTIRHLHFKGCNVVVALENASSGLLAWKTTNVTLENMGFEDCILDNHNKGNLGVICYGFEQLNMNNMYFDLNFVKERGDYDYKEHYMGIIAKWDNPKISVFNKIDVNISTNITGDATKVTFMGGLIGYLIIREQTNHLTINFLKTNDNITYLGIYSDYIYCSLIRKLYSNYENIITINNSYFLGEYNTGCCYSLSRLGKDNCVTFNKCYTNITTNLQDKIYNSYYRGFMVNTHTANYCVFANTINGSTSILSDYSLSAFFTNNTKLTNCYVLEDSYIDNLDIGNAIRKSAINWKQDMLLEEEKDKWIIPTDGSYPYFNVKYKEEELTKEVVELEWDNKDIFIEYKDVLDNYNLPKNITILYNDNTTELIPFGNWNCDNFNNEIVGTYIFTTSLEILEKTYDFSVNVIVKKAILVDLKYNNPLIKSTTNITKNELIELFSKNIELTYLREIKEIKNINITKWNGVFKNEEDTYNMFIQNLGYLQSNYIETVLANYDIQQEVYFKITPFPLYTLNKGDIYNMNNVFYTVAEIFGSKESYTQINVDKRTKNVNNLKEYRKENNIIYIDDLIYTNNRPNQVSKIYTKTQEKNSATLNDNINVIYLQ